jgi:hypothetical protein
MEYFERVNELQDKSMTKKKILYWAVLLAFALLLAACRSAPAETEPTPEPDTVLTAAAQTAEALLTEQAQPTATPTETPVPTLDISPPPTLDLALTPTPDLGMTPTAPVAVTTPGAAASGELAEYIADITIPDGTDMDPGETFTKVWRLRNAGTTTWTTDYTFVFIGGAQMDAPAQVSLPGTVAPGDTVDISINMVAPQQNGLQRGFWQMRNPAGELFQTAVYVEIEVVGGSPATTGTAAPAGSAQVTDVRLSVDDSSPDTCPHTFTFTGSFRLNAPESVRYRLQAGSDTTGFTFDLPGEQSFSFSTGDQTVTYTLNISSSVNGWAEFQVLAPNEATSNQVTFSLSCSP